MNQVAQNDSPQARKAALLAESAGLRNRLRRSVDDLQVSVMRLRQLSNLVRAAGLLALSAGPLLGFVFGRKRRSLAGISGKASFVWQLLRRFIPIVSALRAAEALRTREVAQQRSDSTEPTASAK